MFELHAAVVMVTDGGFGFVWVFFLFGFVSVEEPGCDVSGGIGESGPFLVLIGDQRWRGDRRPSRSVSVIEFFFCLSE